MARTRQSRTTDKKRRGYFLSFSVITQLRYHIIFFLMALTAIAFFAYYTAPIVKEKVIYSHHSLYKALLSLGFSIDTIHIKGNHYTDTQTILALSELNIGDNTFSFRTQQVAQNIRTHPWVNAVSVSRQWPDTIIIHIIEHRPNFLYKDTKRNDLVLMSDNHNPIAIDNLSPFQNLPMVSGRNALKNIDATLEYLHKYPDILHVIESMEYMSERRWNLHTRNNIIIKLPENDINQALDMLHNKHLTHQILDKALIMIDLRDSSRMIIKAVSGKAQAVQSGIL